MDHRNTINQAESAHVTSEQWGREARATQTEWEGSKRGLTNAVSPAPFVSGPLHMLFTSLEHSVCIIPISAWKSPSSEKLPLSPHCGFTPSLYDHSTLWAFFPNHPKAQCLEL